MVHYLYRLRKKEGQIVKKKDNNHTLQFPRIISFIMRFNERCVKENQSFYKPCKKWNLLKSFLLSNKILEWQEKEVEMKAYNVGISFLKAIINGDNDHLFFYPDKKGTVGVSLTKSTWWHFYFTRHLGCAMSVIKPLIWSVYLYVNSEYWNILDKVCTLLSHFLVNMLKNKSMSFSFLLGSNKVQNDELRADSLVKSPFWMTSNCMFN